MNINVRRQRVKKLDWLAFMKQFPAVNFLFYNICLYVNANKNVIAVVIIVLICYFVEQIFVTSICFFIYSF